MLQLEKMVETFLADRPTMKGNNDLPNTFLLLRAEIDEAQAEIGNNAKLGPELADVMWFLLTISHVAGIDIEAEVREKAARNHLKYPASRFQEGSYDEARKVSREEWDSGHGDELFYGS